MTTQHHTVNASPRMSFSRELRFLSLDESVQSLAFPCDDAGRVDLDTLNERERNAHLFARALMGHHYAFPVTGPRGARP
ncbi:hypothetical protein [Variovorax soli]|nr:hypothetical protein [Variovorax soli]